MCNIGKIDKVIRLIIALALFAAAALTPYWWLAIIGLVAAGTALIGFCPLYKIIGLDTGCKPEGE